MNLRFLKEKVVTEYWSYCKDPVLQININGEWVAVPIVEEVNDQRKQENVSDPTIQLIEVDKVPMPSLPKYPNTSNSLE